MGREHRQSERHRVRFKLVYDDGNEFNAGAVANVSEGGLFLETALPLPVGTVVRLAPLNDADLLFEVAARVTRSVAYDPTSLEPAGMGLQFIDLGAEDRRRVADMILKLQERAKGVQGERDPFLGVIIPSGPQAPARAADAPGAPTGEKAEPGST